MSKSKRGKAVEPKIGKRFGVFDRDTGRLEAVASTYTRAQSYCDGSKAFFIRRVTITPESK